MIGGCSLTSGGEQKMMILDVIHFRLLGHSFGIICKHLVHILIQIWILRHPNARGPIVLQKRSVLLIRICKSPKNNRILFLIVPRAFASPTRVNDCFVTNCLRLPACTSFISKHMNNVLACTVHRGTLQLRRWPVATVHRRTGGLDLDGE